MNSSKPRILFIEDESDYSQQLSEALSEVYEIEIVKNRDQLASLLINAPIFHLALLDIHLNANKKDFSGFDVIPLLTRHLPNIPIVAITKDLDARTTRKAFTDYKAYINNLIFKDTSFSDIKKILDEEINKPCDCFFSYSTQDAVAAKFLCWLLENKAKKVWLDEKNIKGGNSLNTNISKGIAEANTFIILLSRHSIKSKWVIKELRFAEKKAKNIIPLLYDIEDAEIPDDINIILGDKRYIPLDQHFQKLLNEFGLK